MEILDGLVLHTSLDLEQHVQGWRLDSFDKIGGPGTLRGIWSKLKTVKQVVGVKHKLTESLSSDDTELLLCVLFELRVTTKSEQGWILIFNIMLMVSF